MLRFLSVLFDFIHCNIKGEKHKLVKCPVCGHITMNNYWICPECMFEYDEVDIAFPDEDNDGPNGMSLNDYKKEYEMNKRK